MSFNIDFDERALKEWHKLDKVIREQFKKKLRKLQENLYIESARLHGDLTGCFKVFTAILKILILFLKKANLCLEQ